jgi:hypothetical protein
VDERVPEMARQVLKVIVNQIKDIQAGIAELEKQVLVWHKNNPVSQRLDHHSRHRADHRHSDCRDDRRSEYIPQWQRVCRLTRAGATTELYRWQSAPRRN